MKTLLALLAFVPALAQAQDPAKPKPAEPAKLEILHATMLRLEAVPNKDRNPSKHRSAEVWVRNIGNADEEAGVDIYAITGGVVTKTVTSPPHKHSPRTGTGHRVEMDVGPDNGWVVVLRRASGELIAVKGSAPRFEVLARTPGALPGRPAPAK